MPNLKRTCGFVFLCLNLLSCALSTAAQTPNTSREADALHQFNGSIRKLVKQVTPSVVHVMVNGYAPVESSSGNGKTSLRVGMQQKIGSGVIVDPDGYIVTNAHVISGANHIRVIIPTVTAGESADEPGFTRSRTLEANEGLGFAIPSAVVAYAYPQLRKYGHVHRGETGIGVQALTPDLAAGLKLTFDSGVSLIGIVMLRQALTIDPASYDAAWRLAKFNYYLATHTDDKTSGTRASPQASGRLQAVTTRSTSFLCLFVANYAIALKAFGVAHASLRNVVVK